MKKMAVVLMAAFLLSACSQSSALEVGEKAPDFTLTDTNGASVKLSDFAGKVVILDFFASWCPPCRQAVPDFISLQKEYGPKGLAVVGVALEGLADAKKFAERIGINYPVLIDDERVSKDYGPVRSIPTIFVIGKDKNIRKLHIGYKAGDKEVFESEIQELLK